MSLKDIFDLVFDLSDPKKRDNLLRFWEKIWTWGKSRLGSVTIAFISLVLMAWILNAILAIPFLEFKKWVVYILIALLYAIIFFALLRIVKRIRTALLVGGILFILMISLLYFFAREPLIEVLSEPTSTPTATETPTFTATPFVTLSPSPVTPTIIPSVTHSPSATFTSTSTTSAMYTSTPPSMPSPTPFTCPPRIGLIHAEGYVNYDKVEKVLKENYIVTVFNAEDIRDIVGGNSVDAIYFPADWADQSTFKRSVSDYRSALDEGIGFIVEAPDLLYAIDQVYEYDLLPGSISFANMRKPPDWQRSLAPHFITSGFSKITVPDPLVYVQADSSYQTIAWLENTNTLAMYPSIMIREGESQPNGQVSGRIAVLATSAGYFSEQEWNWMDRVISWVGRCEK